MADPIEQQPLFSRPINPGVPIEQEGLTVTISEWDRLKQRVRGIRSPESRWLSAMAFSFAACISFGIGAAALNEAETGLTSILVTLIVATFLFLAVGIVCLFGFFQGKGNREDDINTVITYMEDIQEIYAPARSDEEPAASVRMTTLEDGTITFGDH